MKKIILVEDQKVIRKGIRLLIESNGRFEVVAEAANGEEGLSLLRSGVAADLIVTDIGMPEMDGLEMLSEISKLDTAPPVLILSMSETQDDFAQALFRGAAGFLSKSVDASELFFALERILEGERYFCSGLSLKMLEKSLSRRKFSDLNGVELTRREIEIIGLLAQGQTTSEIADMLFLSTRTVEGHRQNLIGKTGVKNTASLIRFACLKGIID
ncbi:response regulator [Pedobacter sp.]|uniref:response regulator n=1 Tax=Pedobacter sp. TaxID=1411316 RepID=UPI003C63252C